MKTKANQTRQRTLKRYSAQVRGKLLKEQERSGLTIKAFCMQRGVNLWTFYEWTKTRRKKMQSKFAEVEIAGNSCATAGIEIYLPNGTRVGIRSEGDFKELAGLIREVCGC